MLPRIALVVPCFNEEARLPAERFEAFLRREEGVHLVLVDDGSTDGTHERLLALAARLPGRARVVRLPHNRGKAEAVRTGMCAALGEGFEYAGYWDADLATPLEELALLAEALEGDPERCAAFGSRVLLLGRSIRRRAVRHYAGRVFATLASATLGLAVYDTQCGAKLFRDTPAVRRLFEEPFLAGWSFDVEVLARLAADPETRPVERKVAEVPLRRWSDVGKSHVHPTDFLRALRDLRRIRRRYAP